MLGAGIETDMMEMGGGQMMAMLPEWTPTYAVLFLVMWLVMLAAMMLPSAAPTILLVGALARHRSTNPGTVPGTAGRLALLFVGGLMSLAWVALIALVVLFEKTMPWGGRTSRLTRCAPRRLGRLPPDTDCLKMKLTLTLDPAAVGVRASLIEEWEEVGRTTRMEPRVRLFDSEEEALAWGRSMASRRGLKQLFLTDNRKSAGG